MLAPVQLHQLPPDFHLGLRNRFLNAFRARANPSENAVIYLRGGSLTHKNDEDVDYPFHQQSNFRYLTGVEEQDCELVLQVSSGTATLIVPRPCERLLVYMILLDKSQFEAKYGLQVVYTENRQSFFQLLSPSEVHLYVGVNSDSGLQSAVPQHDFLAKYKVITDKLFPILNECRVIKTKEEIDLLRFVCKATSQSLVLTMQNAKPGLRETQLSALFQFDFSRKTCSLLNGFNPISACCQSISVLHYLDGEKLMQQGDFVLNDMGGRYKGYVADQAITYPIGGVFSPRQRQVYTAVLEAQDAVKARLREGVDWTQMHLLAQRVLIEHLVKMGVLKGDIAQIQQARVGGLFFPHGLGHFFGLLVHDVGGYNQGPEKHTALGLRNLRTRRILKAGMTITVEPGLYFIRFLLEKAKKDESQNRFIDWQVLEEYMGLGGVRLEDDVLITKEGHEMLSWLPRRVQDVERVCRGEAWP